MTKSRIKKGPAKMPPKLKLTARTHELLGMVHGVTLMNQTVCSVLYWDQVVKAYEGEKMDDGETPVVIQEWQRPAALQYGQKPDIKPGTILGTLFGTQEFVYQPHFPMTADAWNRHRKEVLGA